MLKYVKLLRFENYEVSYKLLTNKYKKKVQCIFSKSLIEENKEYNFIWNRTFELFSLTFSTLKPA